MGSGAMNSRIVHLYPPLPEDKLISIDLYVARICNALSGTTWQAQIHRLQTSNTAASRPKKYIRRWLFFPWTARRVSASSGVHHVCDQSYAHLLAALPVGRRILTVHDLMPVKLVDGTIHPRQHRSVSYFNMMAVLYFTRLARVVIVDSEQTAQDLRAFLAKACPLIIKIFPPVDPVFFAKANATHISTLDHALPKLHPFRILHVGGNQPYKNVSTIIRAVAVLRDEYSTECELIKVGPFDRAQMALIEQLRLLNVVRKVENVSANELRALYDTADVFVFPSLYEGFGWPPLEAMACGIPVISSTKGSLLETVAPGAITIERPTDERALAQAVFDVLIKPEVRRSAIEMGSRWASRFTLEHFASQILDIYESVSDDRPFA